MARLAADDAPVVPGSGRRRWRSTASCRTGGSLLSARRWLARLTYGAGIVGFVGLGLFLSGASGAPVGVVERLTDYPGAAMVVVLGTVLLGSAASGRRRSISRAA